MRSGVRLNCDFQPQESDPRHERSPPPR
jgi:hypothetical protein